MFPCLQCGPVTRSLCTVKEFIILPCLNLTYLSYLALPYLTSPYLALPYLTLTSPPCLTFPLLNLRSWEVLMTLITPQNEWIKYLPYLAVHYLNIWWKYVHVSLSVWRMSQSVLTSREPQDPSTIPYGWKAVHVRVSGLHEGLQQRLWPCQTSEPNPFKRRQYLKDSKKRIILTSEKRWWWWPQQWW